MKKPSRTSFRPVTGSFSWYTHQLWSVQECIETDYLILRPWHSCIQFLNAIWRLLRRRRERRSSRAVHNQGRIACVHTTRFLFQGHRVTPSVFVRLGTTMIIYKCRFTGDEMLSDAFNPQPVKDSDGNEIEGLLQIQSMKVNKVR